MSDAEPLVTVATFDSLMHAELAHGCLEEEGIRSFITDGEMVNTNWFLSAAVGGIKLQVSRSDFLAAERVLNSRRAKAQALNVDDYGLARSTDAITSAPGKVRDDADDSPADEEEDEIVENEAERKVRMALRAAIFGFVLPPIFHVYSLCLLADVMQMREPLRDGSRKTFWIAAVLDLAVIFGALAFLGVVFYGAATAGRP
jgi:hypothetical protein